MRLELECIAIVSQTGDTLQGFFQQFLEKAHSKKWEKMIDLTSKWGEINDKENNKGSKNILKIKLFLIILCTAYHFKYHSNMGYCFS